MRVSVLGLCTFMMRSSGRCNPLLNFKPTAYNTGESFSHLN